MKLYYKDLIGFSCLILIAVGGGLYLLDNLSKQSSHDEYHDKMGAPAKSHLQNILLKYETAQKIRNNIILFQHGYDDYGREFEELLNLAMQYEQLTHKIGSNGDFLAPPEMKVSMQEYVNEITTIAEQTDKINQQIFVSLKKDNFNEIPLDDKFLELDSHGKDFTSTIKSAISMEHKAEESMEIEVKRIEIESAFVIIGMIIFMVSVIAMIMSFSRNPMLSNIKNMQNATKKISEGDFDTRISIVGSKDEVTALCYSINDMAKQLSDLQTKLQNEVTSSKKISDSLDVQLVKQQNLQKALDESSDVSITDKDGIITYVNETFCKLSQYSREEILGNTHSILKSGNHPEIFYKNMWDSILAGKIWHDRLENKKKDGTIYWVDMFIVPFLDKDGKIQEFISIRRDITERMNLHSEKLKNERMVTLGTFTSRLAHDLRNPLTIIQISLENMKALYGTDVTKQSHFGKINRSIKRITHQVDDVLNCVNRHGDERLLPLHLVDGAAELDLGRLPLRRAPIAQREPAQNPASGRHISCM